MIKIIDNFFEEEKLNQIVNHIKKNVVFTPQYFEDATEKTIETFYGNRFILNKDKKLLNIFIKQAEKKFSLKIKKIYPWCGIDLRNMKIFQPHTDDYHGIKLNVLVMLDGPIGVSTGTCFFTENELSENELDIHVGFRPNRAVLFSSDRMHCAHKSDLEILKRYTATLFIQEYEF